MSVLTIRLPDDKHERLRNLARMRRVSVNKLMEELATLAIANHDAWTWFKIEAAQGEPRRALEILDHLDRLDSEAPNTLLPLPDPGER